MAESCREYPGRIAFLAIVVPHDAGAAAEAERAFDLGAVGIGELNADAQGFDLTEPGGVGQLMEVCRAQNRPVLLHSTEPIGHLYPGKGAATPERLFAWLAAYPTQPIVLAHWGGGLPFYELMPEVYAVTRNVTYDSAATTYLYNHRIFPAVISIVGPERVLFATDYPILRQDRLVKRVARLLHDSDSLAMIYAENADRVYRMNNAEEGTG
jgi:predicted TIM-barrel fold metal-dependent hydrolase